MNFFLGLLGGIVGVGVVVAMYDFSFIQRAQTRVAIYNLENKLKSLEDRVRNLEDKIQQRQDALKLINECLVALRNLRDTT